MPVIDTILQFLVDNQWFIALVNITAIASLIITLWVFVDVRNIKSHYVFKGRVPQHTRKLRKYASRIVEYMNDFEGMLPQIELDLVNVEVELESLAKKLNRRSKQSVNQLLGDVRVYIKTQDKDVGGLRQIHRDLHRVVARIEELQEDLSWER